MRRFAIAVTALSTCALGSKIVSAQAFTRVVSFGDSLSDVGNVASQTFGISPGSSYYNNRYSNGPLWLDVLSARLNVGASVNSRAGGYNYATGGTRSGTGYVSPVFFVNLPNAGQQVTDYLATRTPGADELFTIWTGGNDFLDGQTNPAVPADNVQTLLNRLATAGVKNIAVSNLPPLGETPRYNTTADRATMNTRSSQFNAALSSRLDSFASFNPGVNLFRLDVGSFFAGVLSDPSAYGFTNVTDRAMTNGVVVPNPDQYAFYDDVHPTRIAHAMLGTLALDAVTTRRFIGASSAGDNWSVASNWSAARVPDATSIVTFDTNAARLSSSKNVRRLELQAGGRLTLEVDAVGGGRLAILEQANLRGEIALDFAGSYIGLPGETFSLLTFASATGTPTLVNATGFAGLDLLPSQSGTSFEVQLSATAGDANLDDAVDFDDLLTLAQHYAQPAGQTWLTGDFNADTAVTFDDLLSLAQNYGSTAAIDADWALARSMVPEPAMLTLLSGGAVLRRRREVSPR
jgi:phospholipase/lecithinase/hemolysin